MSVSPFLDSIMGVSEGGSQGAQILASMKGAGIETGGYAPWILGGSIATNTLGRFLSTAADRKYEQQNYRLGDQQLQIGALNIEAEKRRAEEERKAERKKKKLQTVMSGIFGEYSRLKGGK